MFLFNTICLFARLEIKYYCYKVKMYFLKIIKITSCIIDLIINN